MDHDNYTDEDIRRILTDTTTIALVGASPNSARPSHGVMSFLLSKGYKVFPVNPGHEGKDILGQKVYAKLADIPEPVDMVDVFRASEYLSSVMEEVIHMSPRPKVVWAQLGVKDYDAAAKGEHYGVEVIMDRCPAIEHPRLNIGR
ncbi:MAG: CoA-binding protein [Agrobacterium cavarae]|uniref:CoA-binding protein n=1 Tax=Agrobacterium cavarae TaxID=2528239 RepID=UPI002FDB41A0